MNLCRAPLFLLLVAALPALAQQPTAAPAPASPPKQEPVDCSASRWILDGAALRVDNDNAAAFRAEWKPRIDAVAACFRSEALSRACASVQGHADDATFDKRVSGAFGGDQAAQLSRARGRALEVVAELYQSGLSAERIREVPPARGSNIRGVEIALIPDCIKPDGQVVAAGPSKVELQVLVRDSVHSANAEREASLEATRQAEYRAWRDQLSFFADGALMGTVTGFAPSTAIGSTLGPSLGARFAFLYARLDTAFGLAAPDSERMGFELGGAAGWYAARWLQLGLVFTNRFSAPSPTTPWLDQTWAVGVEGTHCLAQVSRVDFCLTETVRPFGQRTNRGAVLSGAPVRLPETQGWAMRFDLGVRARIGF